MDWRTENNIKTARPFIVGISANADNQDVAVGLKVPLRIVAFPCFVCSACSKISQLQNLRVCHVLLRRAW